MSTFHSFNIFENSCHVGFFSVLFYLYNKCPVHKQNYALFSSSVSTPWYNLVTSYVDMQALCVLWKLSHCESLNILPPDVAHSSFLLLELSPPAGPGSCWLS